MSIPKGAQKSEVRKQDMFKCQVLVALLLCPIHLNIQRGLQCCSCGWNKAFQQRFKAKRLFVKLSALLF